MSKNLKIILISVSCLILFFIIKIIAGIIATALFEYLGLLNLEGLGANGIANAQDIASINRIKGIQTLSAIVLTAISFFFLKKKYFDNHTQETNKI